MSPLSTPVLVLLPGSLCDERLFAAQVDYFSTAYKVIVPDLSGFNSIDAMARSVLNSVSGSFILAGLSMGGIVALQIMTIAPERVTALALLDTNAWAGSENDFQIRQAQIEMVQSQGEVAILDVLEPLYKRYVFADNIHNDSLRTLIFDMAQKGGIQTFVNHWQAISHRDDLSHVLNKINCPTLILCGADDALCPVTTHIKMAELIAHAKLNIIEECGHMSTLESADQVNTALLELIESVTSNMPNVSLLT